MRKLIGRKVGMTQLFDEKGNVTGVTVIEAGPNYVTQVKTVEKDGYNAIQLGFGEVKAKKLTLGSFPRFLISSATTSSRSSGSTESSASASSR